MSSERRPGPAAAGRVEHQRHDDVLLGGRDIVRGRAIAPELLGERREHRIAARGHLLLQPLEQMGPPGREVPDARRKAARVQAEAQHVHRRRQEVGGRALHQDRHDAVVRHEVPVAIDRQRRIRFVSGEDPLDRAAHRSHGRVGQATLAVHRRVAGGHEQAVAFAQGHLQSMGEAQHHLAARQCAAGLDAAQVPRRDRGLAGEIELRQPAAQAPVAQQGAHGSRSGNGHGGHDSRARAAPP